MQCLDLRRINVEEWMQGCKKVIIQHGSRPYVLTITRRGKLILTAADTPLTGLPSKPINSGNHEPV
ncbi:hemin uptake protein HemP [Thiothrix eikelboomii]|uniref:hemin uptake protein HemP n=1 Tax=Thiothrix eikelboomii TaxID=92487 RepID=UPI003BB1F470